MKGATKYLIFKVLVNLQKYPKMKARLFSLIPARIENRLRMYFKESIIENLPARYSQISLVAIYSSSTEEFLYGN